MSKFIEFKLVGIQSDSKEVSLGELSFDLAEHADKPEQTLKMLIKTPKIAPPAHLILDICVLREFSEQELSEQKNKAKTDEEQLNQQVEKKIQKIEKQKTLRKQNTLIKESTDTRSSLTARCLS